MQVKGYIPLLSFRRLTMHAIKIIVMNNTIITKPVVTNTEVVTMEASSPKKI